MLRRMDDDGRLLIHELTLNCLAVTNDMCDMFCSVPDVDLINSHIVACKYRAQWIRG